MKVSEILVEAQKYPTAWSVSAVGPSDEKFEVTRTVINSQGKYQPEKHGKTFTSREAAEEAAKKLNSNRLNESFSLDSQIEKRIIKIVKNLVYIFVWQEKVADARSAIRDCFLDYGHVTEEIIMDCSSAEPKWEQSLRLQEFASINSWWRKDGYYDSNAKQKVSEVIKFFIKNNIFYRTSDQDLAPNPSNPFLKRRVIKYDNERQHTNTLFVRLLINKSLDQFYKNVLKGTYEKYPPEDIFTYIYDAERELNSLFFGDIEREDLSWNFAD